MKRTNKQRERGNEHFEALDQLLSQLRTHLTGSAATKGTYGDYLRLLEFYRDARDEQAREIVIRCVENEDR